MSDKRLERLACDICWAGFYNPKMAGTTKLRYWREIAPAARADYIKEARTFRYLVRQLGRKKIDAILADPTP